MSYPDEIKDIDEVEPRETEDAGDPESGDETVELDGSEPAGKFLKSGLHKRFDADVVLPDLCGVAAVEDLEEPEDVSSMPRRRLRRAARKPDKDAATVKRRGKLPVTAHPAPKRSAGGPLTGSHRGGRKKQRLATTGPARWPVPIVPGYVRHSS